MSCEPPPHPLLPQPAPATLLNYFVLNYFALNYFALNYFALNYFALNYFALNYFALNYFALNYFALTRRLLQIQPQAHDRVLTPLTPHPLSAFHLTTVFLFRFLPFLPALVTQDDHGDSSCLNHPVLPHARTTFESRSSSGLLCGAPALHAPKTKPHLPLTHRDLFCRYAQPSSYASPATAVTTTVADEARELPHALQVVTFVSKCCYILLHFCHA